MITIGTQHVKCSSSRHSQTPTGVNICPTCALRRGSALSDCRKRLLNIPFNISVSGGRSISLGSFRRSESTWIHFSVANVTLGHTPTHNTMSSHFSGQHHSCLTTTTIAKNYFNKYHSLIETKKTLLNTSSSAIDCL